MSPKRNNLSPDALFCATGQISALLQGRRLQHFSYKSRIFHSFQNTAIWRNIISFQQAQKATTSTFHVLLMCIKKYGHSGRKETLAPSLRGAECEILYISLKIGLLHKIHPMLAHGNCSITTDHDSPLLNVPLSWCDSDNDAQGNLTLPSTRSSFYRSPFPNPHGKVAGLPARSGPIFKGY